MWRWAAHGLTHDSLRESAVRTTDCGARNALKQLSSLVPWKDRTNVEASERCLLGTENS